MAGNERHGSALLLSGGVSRRFGGQAKALLDVYGEPALLRMARIVRSRQLAPVVVVAPPTDPAIAELARTFADRVVTSERSNQGRTASIQEGLSALPTESDVLLWPVDHSFVQEASVDAILEAPTRDPLGRWFIPRYAGHGGHPILLGHEVFPMIHALAADEPLRRLIPMLGPQVVPVPVDDPAVAEPIDTPQAYQRARAGHWGRKEGKWTGD